MADERPPRNPFRNEADAFRVLMMVVGAGAVVVALTLLLFATIRAFRGHFTAKEHRGVEVPGIYWHFVDVMWIVVYTTIYVI